MPRFLEWASIQQIDMSFRPYLLSIRDSYVYWTVHHLDSWVKRDQLDVTCLLFLYLMLNMFRMLIHPSSGACDLCVELLHGLHWSGSMCVGVTCGLAVVVWYMYAGWGTSASACIWIPHHHSQTTTLHQHISNESNKIHEITQQINRKLLRMDVLTSETCWALSKEIKQVTSSWSLFTQLSTWCTVQ